MPLPHAKTIGVEAIEDLSKSLDFHKKKIEHWIEDEILPRLKNYKPHIDLKKRVVKGYVSAKCPLEYSGYRGIPKEKWKELYESIIRPLGYEPVYTDDRGARYDVVGMMWETPL